MAAVKQKKLALHWQILIGMLAGGIFGELLNLNGREHSITLQGGDAGSFSKVEMQDVNGMILITMSSLIGI